MTHRPATTEEKSAHLQKQKEDYKNKSLSDHKKVMLSNAADNTQAGSLLIKKTVIQLSNLILFNIQSSNSKAVVKDITNYINVLGEEQRIERSEQLALITVGALVSQAMKTGEDFQDYDGASKTTAIKSIGHRCIDYIEQDAMTYAKEQKIQCSAKEIGVQLFGVEAWRNKDGAKESVEWKIGTALFMIAMDLILEHKTSNYIGAGVPVPVFVCEKIKTSSKYATYKYIISPEYMETAEKMLVQGLETNKVQKPSLQAPKEFKSCRRNSMNLVKGTKYNSPKCDLEGVQIENNVFKMNKSDHSPDAMPVVYEFVKIKENVSNRINHKILAIATALEKSNIKMSGFNSTIYLPRKPVHVKKNFLCLNSSAEYMAEAIQQHKIISFRQELPRGVIVRGWVKCVTKRPYKQTEPCRMWCDIADNKLCVKWHAQRKDFTANISRTTSALKSLEVAKEMKIYSDIFLEIALDRRGRVYETPTNLNGQKGDFQKAVLEFSEGCTVGPREMYWMKIQAMTLYGQTVTVEPSESELLAEIEEMRINM